MTEMEISALTRCGLFQGMGEPERERLIRCLHCEEVQLDRNEILWHEGDSVTSCAVVLSGTVRAESSNAQGEHTLMAIHRSGALVGDVLMATPGGKSPVYVIASEPSRLLYIPYREIMGGCPKCCPAHTQLRENLIAEIARKFWAQRRRAGYLSTPSLRRRIAMYLLDRAEEAGTTFSLGGTREELAEFLCVNRSALSRELSRMKRDGLLDFYRDTFRLLETDRLEEYV